MAWHRLFLTSLALLWIACIGPSLLAQEPVVGPPIPPPPADYEPRPPKFGGEPRPDGPPRGKKFRKRLEELSPEDRQKVLEKMRRWEQLPGDEKAHQRFIQGEREKRTNQAVDNALKNSGLELNEEQRRKFAEIYRAERRKVEEELRSEMDQKRKERLPALQQKVVELYKKGQ